MLKHPGVSAWHRRWEEFPIPNRFLGITTEIAGDYEGMPLAAKCALRWVAHRNKMKQLQDALAGSILVVQYESFADDAEGTVASIQEFIGLKTPLPVPEVKKESLSKWRSQLSESEIDCIHDIVGFGPKD